MHLKNERGRDAGSCLGTITIQSAKLAHSACIDMLIQKIYTALICTSLVSRI